VSEVATLAERTALSRFIEGLRDHVRSASLSLSLCVARRVRLSTLRAPAIAAAAACSYPCLYPTPMTLSRCPSVGPAVIRLMTGTDDDGACARCLINYFCPDEEITHSWELH